MTNNLKEKLAIKAKETAKVALVGALIASTSLTPSLLAMASQQAEPEGQAIEDDGTNKIITGNPTDPSAQQSEVQVTADVSSSWTVTLPKGIILTNPDGGTGSYTGSIPVTVIGDIGVKETIRVTTDNYIELGDETGSNENEVNAAVTVGTTKFDFDMLKGGQTASTSHLVSAVLTPGEWAGTATFKINLGAGISVDAKNENGDDIHADAFVIPSSKEQQLLDKLEDSGLLPNGVTKNDIDAMIEVESDDFDGLAETTFDVSSITQEGDKVVILHFDETKQEWEYISTETVDSEGKITANFTSYSPVVFVKVDSNGDFILPEPPVVDDGVSGLYNAAGERILTWAETGIKLEPIEGEPGAYRIVDLGVLQVVND